MFYMDKISNLKSQKSKLKHRVKNQEAEILKLHCEMKSASESTNGTKQILMQTEAENAKLKLKNNRLEHEKSEIKKSMDCQQIKLDQATSNYQNLSSSLEQLQQSHKQSIATLTDSINQLN